MGKIFAILFCVVTLYLLSVLVLFLLSLIGPIAATVNGFIQQGGNSILFAAGGVLAAFLLIAFLALAAFYYLLRLIGPQALQTLRNATLGIWNLF